MSLYLNKKDSRDEALESFILYKSYLKGYTSFVNESEFDEELEKEILNMNREYIQIFLENNEKLEHSVFNCEFSIEMFQEFLNLDVNLNCNRCSNEDKIIASLSMLYKAFIINRIRFKSSKIKGKMEYSFSEFFQKECVKEELFKECYRIFEGLDVQENYYRTENAHSGDAYSSNYLQGIHISDSMSNLFEKIKTRDNKSFDFMLEAIFVKSRIAHHIHPFEDKNGRTSRMFMQYILFYEFDVETPLFYSFNLKGKDISSSYRKANKAWNKDKKYCFYLYVHILSQIFIDTINHINIRLKSIESETQIKPFILSEEEKAKLEKSFNYYSNLF